MAAAGLSMIAEDAVTHQQLRSDRKLAEVFLHTWSQNSLAVALTVGSHPW
jgi:hypothetical protein